MDIVGPKVTTAAWGPLNRFIYCGHENGEISIWDWKTGEKAKGIQGHGAQVTDLQFSKERAYFITSSKDMTAKVFLSFFLSLFFFFLFLPLPSS